MSITLPWSVLSYMMLGNFTLGGDGDKLKLSEATGLDIVLRW
ncbi:hypothetical protein WKK05_40740 (plasmid) [Nostoc sp. UHCC 0302]